MDEATALTLSLQDAARRLGVSRATAYRLAQAGSDLTEGVRILKVGGQYRVSVAQLEAVLAPVESAS